jgi:hypothetical protein
MKYIEISAIGGTTIVKKKNIDVVSCHAPNTLADDFRKTKLYHIRITLKRGESLIGFYETQEKMMEEYQNIFDKLFNN